MSYEIYLGDIDHNNDSCMQTAGELRRSLMLKLLMWDSIVLSDSQLLTDPRMSGLMSAFSPQNAPVEDWQRDFEALLRSGRIQVAYRKTDARADMYSVWKSMRDKAVPVPHLPETEKYARYIDGLSQVHREYDLNSISLRYKTNLCKGLDSEELQLDRKNPVDDRFLRVIEENDVVLMRELLQVIKTALDAGEISPQRYELLYRYIYSNYQINLPQEIDCFSSSHLEDIPIHLSSCDNVELGEGPEADPSRIRPTWIFSNQALDLLPTSAFVEILEKVKLPQVTEAVMGQAFGAMEEEQLRLYYDAWEDYTRTMERELARALLATKNQLVQITSEAYQTTQQRRKSAGVKLITNLISACLPVVGNIFGAVNSVKENVEAVILMKNAAQADKILRQRDSLIAFTDGLATRELSIVTKYGK